MWHFLWHSSNHPTWSSSNFSIFEESQHSGILPVSLSRNFSESKWQNLTSCWVAQPWLAPHHGELMSVLPEDCSWSLSTLGFNFSMQEQTAETVHSVLLQDFTNAIKWVSKSKSSSFSGRGHSTHRALATFPYTTSIIVKLINICKDNNTSLTCWLTILQMMICKSPRKPWHWQTEGDPTSRSWHQSLSPHCLESMSCSRCPQMQSISSWTIW